MSQGLQVWNPAGQLILDTNMRLLKILGTVVATAPTGGSLTVPEFADGLAFANAIPIGNQTPGYLYFNYEISGTTLTWSWRSTAPTAPAGTQYQLIYGIY